MDVSTSAIEVLTRTGNPMLETARLTGLSAAGGAAGARDAKAAAQEFEAVFLGQMLQPMFDTLGTDGLFGGGSGERMYRSMLVEEYGRALARNGGIGIADAVERQILALQEIEA